MNKPKPIYFCMLLLAAGCGGPSLQAPADSGQARQALCTTLDAWKRGKSVESLRGASPAVQVNDPDWPAGYRLTNYQVADQEARHGIDLRYRVALTLKDPKGRIVRRNTTYTVGTNPVLTVVRNDPES
jgi:hypothetical protein